MGCFRSIVAIFLLCVPGFAMGQAASSKSEVFSILQGEWVNGRGDVVTEIEGELFHQYTATLTGEVVEEKGLLALQRICPINDLVGPILVFRTFDDAWCYKLVLVERDSIDFVETDLEFPDTWYRTNN